MSLTISCTQSLISMRMSMLSLVFSASHCPLNVTSGMVWTTKGNYQKRKTPLYKFPSSTFSPNWYCADFCKYIWSVIKIQSREKEPFRKVFLTLLTHQHHLVEYYFTVTKIALEIFQIITCTLGVTYNVNVRYNESLMINMMVSLALYKSFFH